MDPDDGTVLSTITISSFPPSTFGLGFDTKRNVFVVTDTIRDEILKVDPATGNEVGSFSAPGFGPGGAAYDSTRDGYWISDFFTNTVDLVNPVTGAIIASLPVPSGASNIAGTGYDAVNDVIMFHSRPTAKTYLIRASDGGQVDVFPTPPSPGANNGQGAAIRPTDLTGYLTNFDVDTIFVVDLELPIPDSSVYIIDIKPGYCPNPLNVNSKGVLPVAILGTYSFDVTQVDPATVELVGVSPSWSAWEDVAAPYVGVIDDASDCNEVGEDGFLDLTLKFRTQDVVNALGDVYDGDALVLQVTGNLLDGTPVSGEDVVVILKKGK